MFLKQFNCDGPNVPTSDGIFVCHNNQLVRYNLQKSENDKIINFENGSNIFQLATSESSKILLAVCEENVFVIFMDSGEWKSFKVPTGSLSQVTLDSDHSFFAVQFDGQYQLIKGQIDIENKTILFKPIKSFGRPIRHLSHLSHQPGKLSQG